MKKNTISLILFNLFNTGSQFLLIVFISRTFSKTDYSTYRQVFLPFEILAPLLGLGLSSTVFYFYPRFSNKQNLLFSSLFLIFLNCAFFEFLLLVGLGKEISNLFNNLEVGRYFYFLGFFAFFSLSNTVIYSFFVLENKIKTSILVNLFSNIILILLTILVILYNKDIHWIVVFRLATYAFSFFIMVFNSHILRFLSYSPKAFLEDCKQIFKYSLPVSSSLLVGVFSYQIDKLLISSFNKPEEFAIYVNGAFEIPLIAIVTSSIASASFGLFTQFCKDTDFFSANQLFKKVTLASSLFIFPTFVFLFYFSEEIITFIFGKQYSESSFVFKGYLLLLPIRIIQYGNILIALGKSKILLFRSIIELVISCISTFLLMTFFGYKMAVFGTVIAVLGWTVPYNLVTISKGFEIRFKSLLPFKKLALVMIGSVVSIFLVSFGYVALDEFYFITKITLVFSTYFSLFLILMIKLKILKIDLNSKYKINFS